MAADVPDNGVLEATDPASAWTELRYSSAQPLPEADGIRDELDGIVLWTVEAVRCYHGGPEQVIARSEVAVFDLDSGLDLTAPAIALGGGIRTAAELVLNPAGGVQADLRLPDPAGVDAFVLFQQVVISPTARGTGLAATLAIRDRVASRRALVGCLTDPPAVLTDEPEFFRGVPAAIQQAWWDRGLMPRGSGLWLLPPDRRRI